MCVARLNSQWGMEVRFREEVVSKKDAAFMVFYERQEST